MKNNAITSKTEDFAKWYTDVVYAAKLATYSKIKGCLIIEPAGYALWENIQANMDRMFKETGHENVYMPLFIPESLLQKEVSHVEGFAPEVAWVTHGGSEKLEERLCVRPTSETLFSDYYSTVVKSYRDLPKLYNQWCSVVRWEKETRPFLRSREFLWQEGHTVHSNKEEAEEETQKMLNIYKTFFEEYLAIPVIGGKKTEKEKFAGAEYTLTIEALMDNGVFLQSATSHYFGQKFSIPFDIKFLNKENKEEYCYQTSWGSSTRMIGALIMVHGDDNGLVLPPKIAPKQVAIIPIGKDENVDKLCKDILKKLSENNIRVFIDNSEKSPGFKFAEQEVSGIPLRIEIGPKDIENNQITIARRDTKEKFNVKLNEDIIKITQITLEEIQSSLYNKALRNKEDKTYECKSLDEVKEVFEKNGPGVIKGHWCQEASCELELKEINGIKSRCIIESDEYKTEKCMICGKKAKHLVIWGIQY